ncbi:hypothetical protein [Cellulomonas sp. Marseille-Q8402]
MTGFRVDVDTLVAARQGHHDLARQVADVETARQAADLPAGALGKLGESDEIHAAFTARYQGLGAALAALREIYENIGDGLQATADGYATSDDEVARLLASYQGLLP